jgi:hypothetical protein
VIAAVEASTGAKLGVATLAAGGRGTVVHAGSWTTGHAWSTIKAPIAVAALTTAADSAFDAAARQAITISDNDAAQALWTSLGSADEAAAATEAVLRRGGDSSTTVQRVKTRPEYSVFGQTTWSLADQVVFAAGFPTGDAADQVWDLMGQIDSSQRWGLAEFSGAHFKGGWGPDDAGYVVRQFGQVPVPGGCAALAIGGWAPDFATGTRALTALADGLADLADQLPTGPCR